MSWRCKKCGAEMIPEELEKIAVFKENNNYNKDNIKEMINMAKFSNAKVGDKVYDVMLKKWGKIKEINKKDDYSIVVFFDEKFNENHYTEDGIYYPNEKSPRLFWNEVNLPSEKEDLPPFDLKEYLKEHPIQKLSDNNTFLFCSNLDHKWYYSVDKRNYFNAITFGEETNIVVETLNKNKVTPEQLNKALKELGWI